MKKIGLGARPKFYYGDPPLLSPEPINFTARQYTRKVVPPQVILDPLLTSMFVRYITQKTGGWIINVFV